MINAQRTMGLVAILAELALSGCSSESPAEQNRTNGAGGSAGVAGTGGSSIGHGTDSGGSSAGGSGGSAGEAGAAGAAGAAQIDAGEAFDAGTEAGGATGPLFGGTKNTSDQFGLAGRLYVSWTDRTSSDALQKISLLKPNGAKSIRAINMRWSGKTQIPAPFPAVLAGQHDTDIDAWLVVIGAYQDALAQAGLTRSLILTNHHEILPSEFAPGEDMHDWGKVGEYVIDRANAKGLKDVYWAPCLMGSQYKSGDAEDYYTAGLIQKAWALAADAYMDAGNDTAEKAFASVLAYAKSKGKNNVVILETAAREPIDGAWHLDQAAAYQSLSDYLKVEPRIKAFFLWNAGADKFTNVLDTAGATVVQSMSKDPFFTRSF